MRDSVASRAESDFELGDAHVRPQVRTIESSGASITVEPLVMQLLVMLSRRAGQLVTRRDLFEVCWGSTAVGDDSLNRVVRALRKALQHTGSRAIIIETVPGAGYILKLAGLPIGRDQHEEVQRAIHAGFDSWRLGLPQPDFVSVEQLRAACAAEPTNARSWSMLALLCRHAAEYGDAGSVSAFVGECESAGRRAIDIDPGQPEALTALVSVIPLFGNWTESRAGLLSVLQNNPEHVVPTQDLATLEMATGCIRAGKALRDGLIARDPLAATYCYKSVFQHWSAGDLIGMDRVADRALLLWPFHPAVWNVRMWTLAYTNRAPAALAMLNDAATRPALPAASTEFLRKALRAAESGETAEVRAAVDVSKKLARTGPGNAIQAMFALGLLHRHDEVFDVAEAYYFSGGSDPVPVRHTAAEMSINEQHRRLTQILFTPVFAEIRNHARFTHICDRIGLHRYWTDNNITPDFLI